MFLLSRAGNRKARQLVPLLVLFVRRLNFFAKDAEEVWPYNSKKTTYQTGGGRR